RRHTILVSDWSSDVCSSDLLNREETRDFRLSKTAAFFRWFIPMVCIVGGVFFMLHTTAGSSIFARIIEFFHSYTGQLIFPAAFKIGRASCREREYIWVVAVA